MSQQALVVAEIGKPLVKITRPIPEPKEGQIQVKVTVAGLNPHDAKAQRYGLFIKDSLPSPLAIDIVGTVTKVGPNVSNFKEGDKVFSLGNPMDPDGAGTQEYAILIAETTAKVPENVNADEAATLALNPLTAFWGLFRDPVGLGIPPPAPFKGSQPGFDYSKLSLAVIGGGSAVGKYVIAWAKYAGFGMIITTASKGKSEKELSALGATHILDRHVSATELENQVREIVGDDLQHVFDAVNAGQDAEVGARLLSTSKSGKLVVICGGDFDASKVTGKNAGFKRIMVFASPDPIIGRSYWEELPKLILNGVLKPTMYAVIEGLNLDKLNAAIAAYNAGQNVVKPQLHID
ncbi:GroES-like protein [Tothia fuscella]|uniref:GroES-like protein n=1 Tax=Tothia fuscella TaxID=1048955 RepID=A0A9P4TXC5_9PEZI|nr:GroES-like protein [Tothia fuscella]